MYGWDFCKVCLALVSLLWASVQTPLASNLTSLIVACHTSYLLSSPLLSPDPTQWTEDQVYQWAEWAVKELQLTSLNLQNFRGVCGQQLCSLSQAELEARASAEYGGTLYHFLHAIKSLSSGEQSAVCVCVFVVCGC